MAVNKRESKMENIIHRQVDDLINYGFSINESATMLSIPYYQAVKAKELAETINSFK